VKIRSHSGSKSKAEYEPALLATRKLQCSMWNERLESSDLSISRSALSFLLKPVDIILFSPEDVHRAIECLQWLCQSFVNQEVVEYCEKFHTDQNEFEPKQILTQCVQEIANRYIFQLLSASRKFDPSFPIPSVYQEQFNKIQSAQLRSSIFNFIS
jgi:hypothetical protein